MCKPEYQAALAPQAGRPGQFPGTHYGPLWQGHGHGPGSRWLVRCRLATLSDLLGRDFQHLPVAVTGRRLPQIADLALAEASLHERCQRLGNHDRDHPLAMPLEQLFQDPDRSARSPRPASRPGAGGPTRAGLATAGKRSAGDALPRRCTSPATGRGSGSASRAAASSFTSNSSAIAAAVAWADWHIEQ